MSLRWVSVPPIFAQSECGFATTINYPVDTAQFTLVQDFGAPSPRHQGRYHTGEDWYGGRATSYGQPVYAAAAGRVTYSYSLGWGRDGGVVIIEHTFPDGTVAFTQYGHMMESSTVTFPPKLGCVTAGQLIGVVGDVRPAPHLHFEVRTANPDTPGPGYSWETPVSAGWRHPSRFISNMQTWLKSAHRWHISLSDANTAGPATPPLVLNDNSLLYLDGAFIKRATGDGRVLWRLALEKPAVSITGYEGRPLLTYRDGTMQIITIDGAFAESWQTDQVLAGAPLALEDWLLFPTDDGRIVAYEANRRDIGWEMDGVPPLLRWHVAGDKSGFIIGLITPDNEIVTISSNQGIVDRAFLRDTGSLATALDGALLAYTRSGLWRIDSNGNWSIVLADAPGGGDAVMTNASGQTFLFDGSNLNAFNIDGAYLWQTGIPDVSGLAELNNYGPVMLLSTTHGELVAIHESGRLCNRTRIFGNRHSRQWHMLGADGVLRVAIADQIIGIDWADFTRACQ